VRRANAIPNLDLQKQVATPEFIRSPHRQLPIFVGSSFPWLQLTGLSCASVN
jgi:hypothetical protein